MCSSDEIIINSKCILEKSSSLDGFRICVMRFVRPYYKYDLWMEDLAPSVKLLGDWRYSWISWDEYVRRYLEEIKNREEAVSKLLDLIKEKKVVTLLCYERDDEFCHRRLLIKLLKDRGEKI